MPRLAPIAVLVCFALPLSAQMHKVAPPEKVTRAVAVYEWTGDLAKPTAARLVPISLFINGHMEDAGVYLAQPMPFALQTGDIYSIEQAGLSQGTFDLAYSRNIITRRSAADDDPLGAWYGYGTYAPLPPPAAAKPLKPSTHIATIDGGTDDDSDPNPHFKGRQPGQPDDSKPAAPTPTSSTPAAPDDPDRPHLSHRTDTTTPATSTVPDDDPDRPTLRHRDPAPETEGKQKKQKQSDSGVIPMSTSLNDDPNRPTMRRGQVNVTAPPAELTTLPPDLHQIVAVSDAATRDPHPFAREWATPTDHTETLKQLQSLAQTRIAQYLTTWHLTPIAATPTGPSFAQPQASANAPTSHVRLGPRQTLNPPPPTLATEQLNAYTLTYGGLPTFVYSAQSPITTGGPVYITLVVQRLPSGELQISLSSLTDAAHLDRAPWLRLVDAVDPDASHRADLLFELRAQTSRQFALYRLVTAHAEQQFVTSIIQ